MVPVLDIRPTVLLGLYKQKPKLYFIRKSVHLFKLVNYEEQIISLRKKISVRNERFFFLLKEFAVDNENSWLSGFRFARYPVHPYFLCNMSHSTNFSYRERKTG